MGIQQKPNKNFNYATNVCTPPKQAILDSGCTKHYVPPDTILEKESESKVTVRIPDARQLHAKTCGIIPTLKTLPTKATIAHKLPNLTHPLLSIGQFCDNGCTAEFNKHHCKIKHNGKTIINGNRDHMSGLWKIPLVSSEGETKYLPISEGANFAYNLEQLTTKADIVMFLHLTMFSPVKSTWLRAIQRNHFVTWPGINTTTVAKYLTPTIATAKGHLDRKMKNIKSTQKLKKKKRNTERG